MKPEGRILLFWSSYLPLWLLFALDDARIISWSGIALILISFATLIVFKQTYNAVTPTGETKLAIKNISNGSSEIVSYLLTIVIPIISSNSVLQFTEGKIGWNSIVTIIIGVMLFRVYITSNLVVINPMLIFLGYSLYLIDYSVQFDKPGVLIRGILITKKTFDPEKIEESITLEKIGNSVYMDFR